MPQRLCDDNIFRQLGRGGERRAGNFGDAAPNHFEGNELDRLVGAGAVAIGFLVLDAVGFFERGERRAVDRSRRYRHLQFEGLALIVEGGGAFERNLLLGKTVLGERRPSVRFKLAEDRVDFRRVDRTGLWRRLMTGVTGCYLRGKEQHAEHPRRPGQSASEDSQKGALAAFP